MGLTTHDSNAFNSITETVPESAEADCVGKYICCFNGLILPDLLFRVVNTYRPQKSLHIVVYNHYIDTQICSCVGVARVGLHFS